MKFRAIIAMIINVFVGIIYVIFVIFSVFMLFYHIFRFFIKLLLIIIGYFFVGLFFPDL